MPDTVKPIKVDETPAQESAELAFCFAGLMGAYLVWGLLQEKIMTQVSITRILSDICVGYSRRWTVINYWFFTELCDARWQLTTVQRLAISRIHQPAVSFQNSSGAPHLYAKTPYRRAALQIFFLLSH